MFEAMNRDSARKLSDSDFWQICHEMHPSTNYTFPVAPMLGVANNDNFVSNLESLDERLGFEQHVSTSEEVSSDDSLQNLYVKKQRAHRKLMSTHSNCVNTQKILDTIDLFSEDEDEKECGKMSENGKSDDANDINHERNELNLNHFESNEIDAIQNADDLLLKIADSVQQLKTNVNQMSELNEKCQTSSTDAYAVGDLIDFSDDWTNGESDNNSHTSDKPIKKVTHSCVQGKLCFFLSRLVIFAISSFIFISRLFPFGTNVCNSFSLFVMECEMCVYFRIGYQTKDLGRDVELHFSNATSKQKMYCACMQTNLIHSRKKIERDKVRYDNGIWFSTVFFSVLFDRIV